MFVHTRMETLSEIPGEGLGNVALCQPQKHEGLSLDPWQPCKRPALRRQTGRPKSVAGH